MWNKILQKPRFSLNAVYYKIPNAMSIKTMYELHFSDTWEGQTHSSDASNFEWKRKVISIFLRDLRSR